MIPKEKMIIRLFIPLPYTIAHHYLVDLFKNRGHQFHKEIVLPTRKLSVLERPLTTARGDGKSYIYSNFNPKYAQMATTILRTYYNFCLPYKSYDKQKLTPAQRLGITDKRFKIEDILYLR